MIPIIIVSRRRRERDRRCAILQAQAQSSVLKRLLWHRPRDDVDEATGQRVADEKIVGQEASSASAAPSCYIGPKSSETVKLKGHTFDAALSSCTRSKLKETVYLHVDSETSSLELMGSGAGSISCLRLSPVGVTTYTESGNPSSAVPAGHASSKWSKTVNLKVNTFAGRLDGL